MALEQLFWKLGIALGLGLLIGLQRERVTSELAGFRTFPLVAVLGLLAALLARGYGGWVVAAGLLALATLILVGNLDRIRAGHHDPGLTTEVALLLTYAVGAYLVEGETAVAVAVGGGTAVLLQFKQQMHGFAGKLGDRDIKAVMQFVLISLVILPVLPDQAYGPHDVLNPHEIWLMVVLIVGISLGGYAAYRLLGEKMGSLLGGAVGGLISSTATTVSYARRSTGAAASSTLAALVIMISSTIAFGRVLVEIGVVAPGHLAGLAPPIVAFMAVLAALAAALWWKSRGGEFHMPEQENPSELKSALVFGALYALVLLAVATGKEYFGNRGLYAVGVLAGLTDMDAITLSTAQLVQAGRIVEDTAWRVIVLAAMSNLLFKGATVALLGHRRLRLLIALLFGLALAAGGLILILWPGA